MEHTILFVDDEENILNSFARLFKNQGYNILTAMSGLGGLKVMQEHDISLVISDHKMPGMSGVEFLARVKDISPDTIRIILTGYSDLEAAVDSINKGEVYRFISKPWNDEELLLTVKQSLDYRDLLLTNKHLTKTVKKQAGVIVSLEKDYPGITEVSRSKNGAIYIEDEAGQGRSDTFNFSIKERHLQRLYKGMNHGEHTDSR